MLRFIDSSGLVLRLPVIVHRWGDIRVPELVPRTYVGAWQSRALALAVVRSTWSVDLFDRSLRRFIGSIDSSGLVLRLPVIVHRWCDACVTVGSRDLVSVLGNLGLSRSLGQLGPVDLFDRSIRRCFGSSVNRFLGPRSSPPGHRSSFIVGVTPACQSRSRDLVSIRRVTGSSTPRVSPYRRCAPPPLAP